MKGGPPLTKAEKERLRRINNFFILEYLKRNVLLDENQCEILITWKKLLNKIISILKRVSLFNKVDEKAHSRIIDFFINKQPFTESAFSDCIILHPKCGNSYSVKKELIVIDELNNEFKNFEFPEINHIEAIKYYDLYYLIQDADIPLRIKRWDEFNMIMDNTTTRCDKHGNELISIYDKNDNMLKLEGKTYGNKSGFYQLDWGDNGSVENFLIYYDPELLDVPPPKDPRLNIFNSSEHEIKIDGEIMKNKSVLVFNSDNILDEKSSLFEMLDRSDVEELYIDRLTSKTVNKLILLM